MAAFNKFHSFVEARGRGVHNLHAHVLKIMLSNVLPVVGNSVKANITEIAAGNGYVAGGIAVGANTYIQTGGVAKLVAGDVVITATGGSIGPFQYAILYNDTAANDELIGWWNYGSSISLNAGEALTVDFDATTGVLQDS